MEELTEEEGVTANPDAPGDSATVVKWLLLLLLCALPRGLDWPNIEESDEVPLPAAPRPEEGRKLAMVEACCRERFPPDPGAVRWLIAPCDAGELKGECRLDKDWPCMWCAPDVLL